MNDHQGPQACGENKAVPQKMNKNKHLDERDAININKNKNSDEGDRGREKVNEPQSRRPSRTQSAKTFKSLPTDLESRELSESMDPQEEARFHSETMRVREVFRYLEPWESNVRPTVMVKSTDPSKDPVRLEPAPDWTPVGCEDTALAAFAQLGALRLNAQRCIVSLVSKDQEIILAESTKTLSLQSDAVHADGDQLWLGTTSFPRDHGMGSIGLRYWKRSKETRTLSPDDAEVYSDGLTKHWHIISDVRQRQHEDLQDRLFVRCAKDLRFYAAVPIRTPSGSVIGTYAVLDDKPRFGLSTREMEFMEDVADTVMSHLEAKRAMMQRMRGDRLVKGMALFNGGKTSLREWWIANYSRQHRGEGLRRRRRSSSEEEIRNERADEEFGQTYRAEDLDDRGRLKSTSPLAVHDQPLASKTAEDAKLDLPAEADQLGAGTLASTSIHRKPSEVVEDAIASAQAPPKRESNNFDLPKEIKGVFARASNLMREALNTEGVMFVDADFARSRRQRRGRYQRTQPEASTSTSDPELSCSSATVTDNEKDNEMTAMTPLSVASDPFNNIVGPCDVLGFSTKIKSSVRGFDPSQKQAGVPKALMNRLLRRYPHGKIFNFHNGKSLSSSSAGEASGSAVEMEPASTAVPKARTKTKEAQDANALAEYVNEPRSIAFLPLWDDRRERWRAGVFVWNVAPNRFLDLEEDVTYLAAFGNSLMSELGRLEIVAADQAKATFISSVSHELRSPLHGVLAGVEFLQDSDLDSYQQEMTTTISTAGKTLLDTINNILDFTKINAFTDAQRKDRKDRDTDRHLSFKSADVGEVGVTSSVDLAVLTENVVSTLVTANQFRVNMVKSAGSTRRTSFSSATTTSISRQGDTDPEDPITVVLDVAKSPTWHLLTSPGSWTRVISNLVGNAFKYTKSGTITIALKTVNYRRGGSSNIELSVEDTGQGISEDFQKHHLWTPFMQENTHAIGTGLGLSIVKQIVEDLGGQIVVNSEIGRGTKVKVMLKTALLENIPSPEQDEYATYENRKVGFVSSTGRSDSARCDKLVRSTVATTCRDWLRCEIETIDGFPENSSADVFFMVESDFEQWSRMERLRGEMKQTSPSGREGQIRRPPVILLRSSTFASVGQSPSLLEQARVLVINQPFGPRKLSRAIQAVLAGKTGTRAAGGRLGHFARMQSIKDGRHEVSMESISEASTCASIPESQDSSPAPREYADSPSYLDQRAPSPALPSRALPILEAPSSVEAPPSPAPSSDNRILLVEDNPVNMKLLIAVMRKLGRSYEVAENGLEAVQLYASAPSSYVLILMDMSMPVMDGFTATETIRTLEEKNKWKRNAIIALTGVASVEARDRAFKAGIDTFMVKPASMRKLKEVIEEMGL